MTTQADPLPLPRTSLLALAYVAFVVLGLPISLMGVAWPTLRAGFALPLDALGLLLITSTAGYLVSSFLIARLINRFGIGPLLVVSSLLSAASLLSYTIAPSWGFIVGMGAVGGFGSGVIDAGLNTYLAAEYNEGQMQWLHASFGLGATLSPLLMSASLALFADWRPAYIFAGLVTVLLTACFWPTVSAWKRPKEMMEIPAAEIESGDLARGLMDYRTPLWETLFRWVTWVSILMFLLYTGAELTLGNWTYTLFTEGRGVSPQLAGLWAGGFWATFTIGRILAGIYARRIRLNTLMIGEIALALLGAGLLWWNPVPWAGVAGVFLVGFAMAPIFPGLVSSTSQRVSPRHAANTIGIQISAGAVGGAFLPSLAGFLAQRISLEAIPVMLTVALLGLLGLYLFSIRVRKAD
ncbi:MAG TPA: MFS transporter [Anaerolineaceae bacterium]|nr:MFS transporter [Anaerolineaceae bacterium]